MAKSLSSRLEREVVHAREILTTEERNWGWHTPAGQIRHQRRLGFLLGVAEDPASRILEVGAGTGTYTHALAGKFSKLLAVDISPDLIERARPRAPHAEFRVMDAHNLEVEDGWLDGVVGCSVLHHLDWDQALAQFHKKLRTGGRLRFSEPNLANPQIFLQKSIPFLKRMSGDSPDEYAFTAGQIRQSLSHAGFVRIVVDPFEFLHPAMPPVLIPLCLKLERILTGTFLRAIGGSLLIEAVKR